MSLTVGVPKETAPGETRVALVPDVVRRLTSSEVEVIVEEGAGAGAHHADADYADAGAQVRGREEALGADVVAVVSPPPEEEIKRLHPRQAVVGLLDPLGAPETSRQLAWAGVTALAMELVPRISRAQKMDALSAMSSLAGYRAALIGAHALPKFFPLLTTAAGTIRPARVLVLGAGVAGLQAIATAKRLGARVQGYDIRVATKEEVESLGAQFVELELGAQGEGEGGYARELQQEIQERQPELLKPHIADADVVISTALIPGRPAPRLVSEAAVAAMASGSVVVDLAAPGGGNCALTRPGETVRAHGVSVFGPTNLPAGMPVSASQLYARTVAALVEEFVEDGGSFTPDFDDEVFAGACVAYDGEVRNDRVREALGMGVRAPEPPGDRERGAGRSEEDPSPPAEERPAARARETTGGARAGRAAEEEREAEEAPARVREAEAPGAREAREAGEREGADDDEQWRPPANPSGPAGENGPGTQKTGTARDPHDDDPRV